MRVARVAARVVGWIFVATIAYHGMLAVRDAVRAGSRGNWTYAAELSAIALVATALVIAALAGAARSSRRPR